MHSDDRLARWREIDALFVRAMDLPVAERAAFLAEEAGEDEELLRAVAALFSSLEDAEADGLLDTPVAESDLNWKNLLAHLSPDGSGDRDAISPDRTGERVGPYRIVREAGRGGMATVYEAERADGQWKQRVALKVMRRGLDTDDVIALFLAERQILSSLEHPGIARLLDGGATDDGLPYLVMEYVEGAPVTDHCDERRLGVKDRLELFVEVCRAVQYAHGNLVLHRDLKPSNILVTSDGAIKLLDFGIAKLLEESSGDATLTQRRRLTPQFASPELARGEKLTVASDVYQLGILLCELLAGRRPYDVTARSPDLLEEQITGASPRRPSQLASAEGALARGTSEERLVRRLKGDLDAIVEKCLRKEPEDRYHSVGALVTDLERHAEGYPIAASRGAVRYRFGKFVRRHAVGLGVTAAFIGLLLGAVAALSVQRDRAVAAAETADEIATFLAGVFGDADPTTGIGDTMSVRTQLARGTQRIETELADRPALQAELYRVIGEAYRNLGLIDEGVETLAVALERARTAHPPQSEEVREAVVALARTYQEARDYVSALPLYEENVEIRHGQFGPDHAQVAEAVGTLAGVVRDVIGPDSAEVLLRAALDMDGLDPASESGLFVSLSLAFVLRAQGRLDEAEALYREGVPALRAIDPNHPELRLHLNNLAFLLSQRGAYGEAAATYAEAYERQAEVYGHGHPMSLMVASNRSVALFRDNQLDEGMAVMDARILAAREQWPEGHWRVAQAIMGSGMADIQFRDGSEAVDRFRRAVPEFVLAVGESSVRTAAARAWLGAALLVIDSDPEGRSLLEEAIEVFGDLRLQGEIENPGPFHIDRVAEYLEDHGHDELAVRLRGLLKG